ncbi:MAG: glycogen synthase [Gemmatales bacterium]|nr:MAG: glycogen synthase [Gemmatales bacterium]
MKLLFLVTNLEPSGPGRQALLLAPRLAQQGFQVKIVCLSKNRQSHHCVAVPLHVIEWNRRLAVGPVLELRQAVRVFQPDVIHVWSLTSLWALALTGGPHSQTRIILSQPFSFKRKRPIHFAERWLLKLVSCIAVASQAEAMLCQQLLGMANTRITTITTGVETDQDSLPRGEVLSRLSLPANCKYLFCPGPLEREQGVIDAVWSFDILRYIYPHLHLVVAGTGSAKESLFRYRAGLELNERVHFPGPLTGPLFNSAISHAELVWLPAHREGCVESAVLACAAGKPVVGTRVGQLVEIIVPGETGLLVAPGDKVGLAKAVHELLADEPRLKRMGQRARALACRNWPIEKSVEIAARLYKDNSAERKFQTAP